MHLPNQRLEIVWRVLTNDCCRTTCNGRSFVNMVWLLPSVHQQEAFVCMACQVLDTGISIPISWRDFALTLQWLSIFTEGGDG